MCGISGAFSTKEINISEADMMIDRLRHRGPDGSGKYVDQTERVFLGHNRLSIIDLSDENSQPFQTEGFDGVLVFNGEIYNFCEIRDVLVKKGYVFRTTGDTEVILKGFSEWGNGIFQRLQGMFAIAIWNAKEKTLILARDSFGIKPLYYFMNENVFVFASEIKALFAYHDIPRTLNVPVVCDLASFGFAMTHESVFKGISQVEPGYLFEIVKLENRIRVRKQEFLSLEKATNISSQEIHDRDFLSQLVRDELRSSVQKHLVSDAPLAMSLSGGLDSSAVCALASQSNPEINCFTVGYDLPSDETPFAREVSDLLEIKQHICQMTIIDIEKIISRIVFHLEEPIPNIQAMTPLFLGLALHRSEFKVVLLGEGSDEMLGGYPWHALSVLPGLAQNPGAIFDIYAWKRRASVEALKILFNEKVSAIDMTERLLFQKDLFIKKWKEASGTSLQRFLQFDASYQLMYSQLLRVDKMLMANSVEGRVPFLFMPFLHQIWNIPDSARINLQSIISPGFQGKMILRKAMQGILPMNVVYRQKFGKSGTQNLYQTGVDKLLNNLVHSFHINEIPKHYQDLAPFLNWEQKDRWANLPMKSHLFLLLLLKLIDIGIIDGFTRPNWMTNEFSEVGLKQMSV